MSGSLLHYLVIMLQQDPDNAFHTLHFHGLPGKLQQVLQGIGRRGGFAQVDVERCGLAGLGQAQLLGRQVLMLLLRGHGAETQGEYFPEEALTALTGGSLYSGTPCSPLGQLPHAGKHRLR